MMRVRDVMTAPVVSVRPSTPLAEVARLLVDRRISGVPVVGDDGSVLGLVTEADFLVKEQGPGAIRHRPLAWLLGDSSRSRAQVAKLQATTAGEAMTAPVVTIAPERSVSDAARLMTERRVNRLPVVEDGKLLGIVTRADVVRVYARSDAELAEMIRQDVLRDTLWHDPNAFEVEVHDGRVAIAGHVERRSTAGIVERSIRAAPGVVDVDATITWSTDDSEIEPPARDLVSPYGPS